ncbi:MAG: alkaline shock response membrane anchor protein AmaP [Alicyclobacillus herbarius]|uniref:alkaline shock response membrane anchor protein AmaP n=1 Tax=Alicyclobacillus herbarius TaxID=122960 RepID=UPI0004266AD1|nr:alkaline shock response membrane anchor protein AmaP [Alicyclobacillus herbarius]MCL6631655.1 alkaline shock response membrane anchor protein AmaP [Alicyclobacillus herbarius]
MSIIDRFLLVILSLGVLCASILLVVFGLGAGAQWQSDVYLTLTTYPGNIYTVVLAVVFALVALRFLFYRVGKASPEYISLPGPNGQIRISFDTIRQLTNRTGREIRGVQEFDSRVRHGQNGILLAVRVRALPDVDLSAMGSEIQSAVKEYVERNSGILVERITVNVVELARSPQKVQRA